VVTWFTGDLVQTSGDVHHPHVNLVTVTLTLGGGAV